jgi:hypothetical protein
MTGHVEMKDWPVWANVLIGLLIGIAIIWIPIVWLLRYHFNEPAHFFALD